MLHYVTWLVQPQNVRPIAEAGFFHMNGITRDAMERLIHDVIAYRDDQGLHRDGDVIVIQQMIPMQTPQRVRRWKSKEEFAAYLAETLIPDLKDSGSEATAEDFEVALAYMGCDLP